ncbi:MAG: dihydrolipoyl dehydrogenase [Pseudomonadota bacterium]|jgi:dihydrolipoamide dehydrogenase
MSKVIPDYQVIVIGAGPAGYMAAIRAAQLGFKTACIDHYRSTDNSLSVGGTYINAGCIAAMSLLESAKLYQQIQFNAQQHGIEVDNVQLNMQQMQARKQKIIRELSQQTQQRLLNAQVQIIHGHGYLLNERLVQITPHQGEKFILSANHIVLATGSVPMELACAKIDQKLILDSTAMLNLTEIPKTIGIIGAGIIGLELASIWHRLGSEVILLDAQEQFLPATDSQISTEAYQIYQAQGLDLRLGARVIATQKQGDRVIVDYQFHNQRQQLTLDKLVVACGRRPNSEKLAAAEANLLIDDNGFVHVDENSCTNLPGVYAIGDLTLSGPMLAHKGLEEGMFIAEYIAQQSNPIHYDILPCVIYTDPEIAWVGQTERSLKAKGAAYKVGLFSLAATSKAQAIGKTEGLVKILSHTETDVILGVHIIANSAAELIAEAVLAMEFSASAEDLARTIHARPSISEALHEATLSMI